MRSRRALFFSRARYRARRCAECAARAEGPQGDRPPMRASLRFRGEGGGFSPALAVSRRSAARRPGPDGDRRRGGQRAYRAAGPAGRYPSRAFSRSGTKAIRTGTSCGPAARDTPASHMPKSRGGFPLCGTFCVLQSRSVCWMSGFSPCGCFGAMRVRRFGCYLIVYETWMVGGLYL